MKKFLLAGVALLIANSAMAADMPVKAPVVKAVFSWTGCYFGGHLGAAHNKTTWSFNVPNTTQIFNQDTHHNRGLAGGQIGCNYQAGWAVFGVEADGSWLSVNHYGIMDSINRDEILRTKYSSMGTVRGRLGWAADRVLFYVTAGAAFARISNGYENYTNAQLNVLTDIATVTSSRTGFVAGVGAQVAMTDNWILGAEFLYYDFGKHNLPVGQLLPNLFNPADNWNIKNTVGVARVRLDYKFGGGAVVAAY
jgi:outer membrane immunogenic protein